MARLAFIRVPAMNLAGPFVQEVSALEVIVAHFFVEGNFVLDGLTAAEKCSSAVGWVEERNPVLETQQGNTMLSMIAYACKLLIGICLSAYWLWFVIIFVGAYAFASSSVFFKRGFNCGGISVEILSAFCFFCKRNEQAGLNLKEFVLGIFRHFQFTIRFYLNKQPSTSVQFRKISWSEVSAILSTPFSEIQPVSPKGVDVSTPTLPKTINSFFSSSL